MTTVEANTKRFTSAASAASISSPGALHVHLLDLLRVALGRDLRGEMHHALRRVLLRASRRRWTGAVRSPTTAVVPSGSEPGRRTSASTSWPRADQLAAGRMADEPARSRDEDPHERERYPGAMDLPVRGEGVRALGLALPPARMPRLRGTRPLKRWRYVGYYSADLMLCAADARIGPVPQRWWAVAEPDGTPARARRRSAAAGWT